MGRSERQRCLKKTISDQMRLQRSRIDKKNIKINELIIRINHLKENGRNLCKMLSNARKRENALKFNIYYIYK